MNFEELAEKLENDGVGTIGEDIFAHHMPEDANVAIVMLSEIDGAEIREDLPKYRTEVFRIVVRHNDYASGLALANQVSNALNLHNEVVGLTTYKRLRPTTDPVPFPVSEGDKVEFLVPMWAAYVLP